MNMIRFNLPYETSLSSLMHEQGFKQVVAPMQFNQINLVRKLGNAAVHTNARIKPQEALYALKLLHGFIGWIVQIYSEEKINVPAFSEELIPKEEHKDRSKDDLLKMEEAYHRQQGELKKLEKTCYHKGH